MIAIDALHGDAETLLAALLNESDGSDASRLEERIGADCPSPAREALLELLRANADPTPTAVGDQLGPFKVVEVLSDAGRPGTLKAEGKAGERAVVLKSLEATRSDPAGRARAILEQVRLGRVDNDSVARVHGLMVDAGRAFVVRDFVEGVPLSRVMATLKDEPVPPDAPTWRLATGARGGGANVTGAKIVCRIGDYAARALAAAAKCGATHGAIKESNLIVDQTVKPTLVDFGCSRSSVPYLAPEQLADACARTEAADLYALGVVLYQCLTRVPVFDGDDASVRQATMKARPVRPSKHNFKAGKPMETITLALLEKEPDKRYASAAEVQADLDRYHRNDPIQRKAPSLLGRLFGG